MEPIMFTKKPLLRIIPCLVSIVLLSAGGCAKDDVDAEKKIIAYDPSFSEVLDQRNALREKLVETRAGYASKINAIDRQIKTLEQQKTTLKTDHAYEVEQIRRQMEPAKRQMMRDLIDMERKYRRTSEDIRDIERDIREITALIEKKDSLAFSQEEMRTWTERRAAFIKKKESLCVRREKLKKDIEMTRLKTSVMDI